MTWLLLDASRRVLCRGSRDTVLAYAEEMGGARILTCGAHTADPATLPQLTRRDLRIVPEATVERDWRMAA